MSATAHEISGDGECGGIAACPICEGTTAPATTAPHTKYDDESAYRDFALAYSAKFDHMVGQLRRMGIDRHRAPDAVHDAFLNCWEKRHQLRDPSRLSGWVMVSAIHRAYSSMRRDRRLVQWPDEFQPAGESGIDESVIDLHRAFDNLPARQREVLELTIEGLSGKAIAGQLDTTLDAVYAHASHARRTLREEIGCDDRKSKQSGPSPDHLDEQGQARLA